MNTHHSVRHPVQFVGAGPGAADLLTVRAAQLLAQADLVLYPGTYLDDLDALCRPNAKLVDTQMLNLDQIISELAAGHHQGQKVVRLVSGDPSLYSAMTEQTRRLDSAGVTWDVCPGVPAYAAAAAAIGRELTVPELVQSVVLTRAQARSTPMPAGERLDTFAETGASLVLHLAVGRIREVMDELAPLRGADCPVVVVYRVSQPSERVIRSTVGRIADEIERAQVRQAAVILVGPAVGDLGNACAESHLYAADRDRSSQ